jgi:hypothetical protein
MFEHKANFNIEFPELLNNFKVNQMLQYSVFSFMQIPLNTVTD